MQVEALNIERRPSYDNEYPNQLVGLVKLKGVAGTQEIVLSPGALSRVFGVVASEVQDTARRNAEQVKRGMQDAVDMPLLAEAARVQLPA